MKKIFLLFIITAISFSCKAQKPTVLDLSKNKETNYIFANLWSDTTYQKEIFKRGMFVKIFKINDSKATPENFSPDTHEFLDSYIISIVPDGDYYTNSKLYKIEGLYNPKILEIKETIHPKFNIKIEYGGFNKRKVKYFEFIGIE